MIYIYICIYIYIYIYIYISYTIKTLSSRSRLLRRDLAFSFAPALAGVSLLRGEKFIDMRGTLEN